MPASTLRFLAPLALLSLGLCPQFVLAAKPGEAVGAGSIVQLVFGLLVVLAAIALGAFLLRRLGKFSGPAGGALRILGGVSLGARERVVLMQVGDQQLLLGVAPGRVQTLHVLARPVAVDSPTLAPAAGGFADGSEARAARQGGRAGGFAERLAQLMRR
jgi:flagellar protein FliO/FliZ